MLPILLLILKITGIVILAVFGLVLLVLLLLLLVPVRYGLSGSYYGNFQGTLKVTWLLHALWVKVTYEDGLDMAVRVLGKQVFQKKEGKDVTDDAIKDGLEDGLRDAAGLAGDGLGVDFVESAEEEDAGQEKEAGQEFGKSSMKTEAAGKKEASKESEGEERGGKDETEKKDPEGENKEDELSGDENLGEENSEKTDDLFRGERKGDRQRGRKGKGGKRDKSARKGNGRKRKKCRRDTSQRDDGGYEMDYDADDNSGQKTGPGEKGPDSSWERLTGKAKGAADSIKNAWTKMEEYKEKALSFWNDERNQKTLRLILRQAKAIVRHVIPRKARGKAVFGFDDPAVTGKILAGLSVVYAWYGDNLEIVPVFDQKILEVEGSLKGRIQAGVLVARGVRVLLDKNFRRLAWAFLKNGGI